MIISPYKGLKPKQWRKKTLKLIQKHPLERKEIVEVVLGVWDDIFKSGIGKKPYKIGVDIFPKPQIMGFLLHELIALVLRGRHPKDWRGEADSSDKDLVYIPDGSYSVEIKTSSHRSKIFGNRSYAQEGRGGKKSKSGYYLAVNFEKCTSECSKPRILLIRFGWLDAADWRGQKAATGQQASLPPEIENSKLIHLFPERQ